MSHVECDQCPRTIGCLNECMRARRPDPYNIRVGDPIDDSPVGAGTVTDITEVGWPKVNHIAVTWLVRSDGCVFDPLGNQGKRAKGYMIQLPLFTGSGR